MRIGFAGTHSTGKTTAALALYKELNSLSPKNDNWRLNIGFSRILKNNGLLLNKKADDFSQMIQMSNRIAFTTTFENSIIDRTIYDVLAYTKYNYLNEDISKYVYNNQIEALERLPNLYDIIFFFPSKNFKLEEDGVRVSDIEYREIIEYYIKGNLSLYSKARVIEIDILDLEGRIKFMMDIINEKS